MNIYKLLLTLTFLNFGHCKIVQNQKDNDDITQLKSKFGDVDFRVAIYPDSRCYNDSLEVVYHKFDFPVNCSCANSDIKCFHLLVQQPYFLNYQWNLTYISQNLNISQCIYNNIHHIGKCFQCESYYFDVKMLVHRKLCWLVDVGIVAAVIAFLAFIFLCGVAITYRYRRRNNYELVPDNTQKRYRFYTNE